MPRGPGKPAARIRAAQWIAGAVFLALASAPPIGRSMARAQQSAPPAFPSVTGADGKPFVLARGQYVIVNFWASWCVPCRTELPSLERLAAANGDRLVIVAASVDTDRAAARAAFAGRYPHLRLAYAKLDAVQAYGALGMPYSVVLDKAGVERRRVPRAIDWSGADGAAVLAQAGLARR